MTNSLTFLHFVEESFDSLKESPFIANANPSRSLPSWSKTKSVNFFPCFDESSSMRSTRLDASSIWRLSSRLPTISLRTPKKRTLTCAISNKAHMLGYIHFPPLRVSMRTCLKALTVSAPSVIRAEFPESLFLWRVRAQMIEDSVILLVLPSSWR